MGNIVVSITGDNAEVNEATADHCGLPLSCCASHKFNWAVKGYLDRHSQTLDGIHSLMVQLNTPKMGDDLREFTKIQPILRNKTRWLSSLNMISKFLEFAPHLKTLASYSKIVDNIP